MSGLKNPRHEKFAQLFVTKGNATECYIEAGYCKKGAKENASRLITNDNVSKRIAELQKETANLMTLTRAQIADFLCRTITTPLDDVEVGSLLIQKRSCNAYGETVETVGKMDAIKELNRMCGFYEPEKVEVNLESELLEMIGRVTGAK